jgi:aryl-alcohol dehydrogenase-like predicted oxidoreductase
MVYETIPGVDKPVSAIIYGCTAEQMMRGEDADDLLDAVYACGITAFDTAENYGLSEVSLGRWMKRKNNRSRVVVLTKGCHPRDGKDRLTPEDLRHDIEQSFARLQTDYIDIYLLHRDDWKTAVGPIVETLNEYHRQGKIGAFGGSNWTHERIDEANRYAAEHGLVPFTVSSPNFGLCNQVEDPWGGGSGCVSISGPEQRAAREWYARTQMPVFAYSSLGRGMFSGKVHSSDMEGAKKLLDPNAVKGYCYPENFERLKRAEILAGRKNCTVPQIALAWTRCQGLRVFPIVSAQSAERIESNVRALAVEITEEEARWLDLRDEGGSSK